MNQTQLERWGYIRPECEIIETNTEKFICVSVRPDASSSSAPYTGNPMYDEKGEYDVGTILIGDPSTVAPAKQSGWFEEEEDFN